jgi:mannose-1-phosphate guanylyltransferase/mannose-6-phosphate isomerase
MPDSIVPIILCGGAGVGLWPVSRENRPKQFVDLFGNRSSFQNTVLHVADEQAFETPIVITSASYRFLVREQLAEIGIEADILLGPTRRDSGPAAVAGAIFARSRAPDPVIVLLSADEIIGDSSKLKSASLATAEQNGIVLFGLQPNSSAAGALLFRASVFLQEYTKSDVQSVHRLTRAVEIASRDLAFVILDKNCFEDAKCNSIETFVQRADPAGIVPIEYDRQNVGSWREVYDNCEKDERGNAVRGTVVFQDVSNCFVSSDKALVALEGVEDLFVVSTQDALLIFRQRDAAALKRLVAKVRAISPQATDDHLRVHRPWGSYRSVDVGDRHQVKRITVAARWAAFTEEASSQTGDRRSWHAP